MVQLASNGTHLANGPAIDPRPHLFVGLCSHDSRVHVRFMMSLMSLVACGKYKITLSNVSSGGIHKARNNLAWEFLTRSDAPWYLSVDSDIGFEPGHVDALISHDVGVVGGPYCHKKPQLEWSARALNVMSPADPKTGLQELNAHGTGFMLIKREVFEAIRRQSPEITHIEDWNEGKGETKWDFFSEGVVTEPGYYEQPTMLSEDFYFCKRARNAGYKIYVDTRFHVMHWDGGRGYPEPAAVAPPQRQDLTVPDRMNP